MAKKPGNLLEMPVVEITWADATSLSPWVPFDEANGLEPVECKTVGRLAKSNKKFVVVVPTINSEGQCGTTWSIPRQWITKIETIRKGRKAKSG